MTGPPSTAIWRCRKEGASRILDDLRYGVEGDLEDPEAFRQWTPSLNADKIKIPMLVLHGTGGERVDIEQYDIMRSALNRAGVEYETYRYTKGGHGFGTQDSWGGYYAAQSHFLRKHIRVEWNSCPRRSTV